MGDKCNLCPRNCAVDRCDKKGYCNMGESLFVSRAALHMWEEPCISGDRGSGTVFFSGCNLGCIYCQNHRISKGETGIEISVEKLVRIYHSLENMGAHNINLVTGSHFIEKIAESVEIAKKQGIKIPFIYNTSSYEKAESLKMLDGLIDIYLPDFKYYDEKTSRNYSNAPDYTIVAKKAIEEMVRQCPRVEFDDDIMLQKGVIIRHMLIPGHVYEGKKIMKYLWETYGDNVLYSIMSQYTPVKEFENYPNLSRRVRKKEYDSLVDFCLELGMENAYIQEGDCAKESFIPDFDELKIPEE